MTIPDASEILLPWQIISDSADAVRLSTELSSEVPPNHALYGLKATAVANRIDRDDVLFNVDGGSASFAVVHLSWRQGI